MAAIVHSGSMSDLSGASRHEPTMWVCTDLDCVECNSVDEGPEPDDPLQPELTLEELSAPRAPARIAKKPVVTKVAQPVIVLNCEPSPNTRSRKHKRKERDQHLVKQALALFNQGDEADQRKMNKTVRAVNRVFSRELKQRKKQYEQAKRNHRASQHDWPRPKEAGAPYKLDGVTPYKKCKSHTTPKGWAAVDDGSCFCDVKEACLSCTPHLYEKFEDDEGWSDDGFW